MIHTLHWDIVRSNNKDQETVKLFLWPAPIDHDECFKAGGFNDFADTNDIWHEEFKQIIESLIAKLKEFGEIRVENDIKPKRSFFHELFRFPEKKYSLVEQIVISTCYSVPNFGIWFGEEVLFKTGTEHQLLIIDLPNDLMANSIVNFVAKNVKSKQTHLNWEKIEKI